jgi:DNA-binding transcriptional ArsR family regulator
MADILPTRPDPPSEEDKEPRVVGLDSDEVSDLLSAISSETARSMLSALHDEPATPSELADRVDTSIQNAQYHLGKLEDADLVEPGGTAYSEKGREMTVYTPADRALVVVAGGEDDTSGLQSVLAQLLGGLGVVALGSVVVERLTRTGAGPDVSLETGADGGAAGGAANATAATATAEPTATAAETAAPTAQPTSTPGPATTPTGTSDGGGGGFSIAEATETATPQATGTEPAGDAATVTESARTATETAATQTTMETATETPQATSEPTATAAAEATRTATETVRTTVSSGADPGVVGVAALSPGELFFLGGVVTLAFTTAYWWLRS